MKIEALNRTLERLEQLIRARTFAELETDTLEIKPVPSDTTGWRERHKSACAFLNTRGGILLMGIKEVGQGNERHYEFTGWKPTTEDQIKQIPKLFQSRDGADLDLGESFPPPELVDFMGGKLLVQLVDELPSDRKFAFYRGEAYRRVLTGDHKVSDEEIDAQEAFKEEALLAREVQPVDDLKLQDLDLEKLNQFIFQLNQPVPVETLKADLEHAIPFLERKRFIKEGRVTTLGALVCAKHPGDHLEFRSHVHAYVDVPTVVAQDKQDYVDNVLQLMESSLGYLLRNTQVGVSVVNGGSAQPQYPISLLRETVNNALAHRDYKINRQVIVSVKPGAYVAIQNPGTFRKHLLIEDPNQQIPLLRVLPEAKPRNPKLADVLRVFRKWEGRGIGMATMVNLCLQNQIDLPYYRLGTEEVTLHLCAGKLLDERMERLFKSFEAFILVRLMGHWLTEKQKLVLAYLIKSEWANELVRYTILLTPDNNHFNELKELERCGLIEKHSRSTAMHPIYVANRILMRQDYSDELRTIFGERFLELDLLDKHILSTVYQFNTFTRERLVSAKTAAFSLWHKQGGGDDIHAFDEFYRKIRRAFNRLQKKELLKRGEGTKGYTLTQLEPPDPGLSNLA